MLDWKNMPQRASFRLARNYVAALGAELGAPLLRALARIETARPPVPLRCWRKGLLLGADHIGDVLYLTPSLPILREAFPQCEWYMSTDRLSAQVVEGNPHLDGVVEASMHAMPFAERRMRLMAMNVDGVLCYNSAGYWRELVLTAAAGIPSRVGFVHKGFSGLVTHPISIRLPQSYPALFRGLVAQLAGRAPDWSLRPQVYPSEADQRAAAALWAEFRLGEGGKPVVVCFLTSRSAFAVWPFDYVASALQGVVRETGADIILCGSAADAPILERVRARLDFPCFLNAGRLHLRALVCFLRRCQLVFTPDSGPRHLANAAGVPVVFIRNPSHGRIAAGAYVDTEYDLGGPDECLAPGLQSEYFRHITPEAAIRKLSVVLAGTVRCPS
jgi:ADP-heptose:LPS heptosyltransferase